MDATSIQGTNIAATAPSEGETQVYDSGTNEYRPGKPVPDGWYDVTAHGLVASGVTPNDAAFHALQTLMDASRPGTIYFPPGDYYFADDVHIVRPCRVVGAGASQYDGGSASTLTLAPGAGVHLEYVLNGILDGGHALTAQIEDLEIRSTPLSLTLRTSSTSVSVGDRLRTPREDDNRYYFEVLVGGTTAAISPEYRGCYLVDRSVEFNATNVPNGSTVVRGKIVRDLSQSTSVFWVCTASSSPRGTGTPIFNATLGTTTNDGGAVWTARSAAGYWLNDGAALVSCRMHAGVQLRTQATLRLLRIKGFTNAGIAAHASLAWADPCGTSLATIDHCKMFQCGVGFSARGLDANQIMSYGLDIQDIGSNVLAWGNGASLTSTGGIGYWDGSFLGNQAFACHVAAANGHGYIMGLFDNEPTYAGALNPSFGGLFGCYLEGSAGPAAPLCYRGIVLGGNLLGMSPNGGTIVLANETGAQNIFAMDTSGPKHAYSQLNDDGYDRAFISINDDNPSASFSFALAQYESAALGRPGWWSRTYGALRASGRAFSGRSAAEGYGWEWQPHAEFRGGTTNSFAGQYFVGLDASTLRNTRVREVGHFLAGDRFELQDDGAAGGWTGYIVKAPGYRGFPWTANYPMSQAGPAGSANYATVIEPSANAAPIPTPGSQAWKCTQQGVTGAIEPTWPTSPVPGVTTVNDNTVVWTYLGVVPEYARLGYVDDPVVAYTSQTRRRWCDSADTDPATAAPKAGVDSLRASRQTTSNAVNQTLLTTDALADNSCFVIDVLITGKKSGNFADVVSARLSGTYYRNAGGAPTNVPTDDIVVKGAGTLGSSSFSLAASGNAIQILCSPGANVTVDWSVVATVTEGKA